MSTHNLRQLAAPTRSYSENLADQVSTWAAEIKELRLPDLTVMANLGPGHLRSLRGPADIRHCLTLAPHWQGECLIGASPREIRAEYALGLERFGALARVHELSAPAAPSRAQQLRPLLAELSALTSCEELTVPLRELVGVFLNWDEPVRGRDTAPVVRAFGALMSARPEREFEDRSLVLNRWAQAVEMLAFAAALAPLLEPDAIARVVSLGIDTPNAHAPADPFVLNAQLMGALGRYQAPRREALLVDLWQTSHGLRWWNRSGASPFDALAPRLPAPTGAGAAERRDEPEPEPLSESDALLERCGATWDGTNIEVAHHTPTSWWYYHQNELVALIRNQGAGFLAALRTLALEPRFVIVPEPPVARPRSRARRITPRHTPVRDSYQLLRWLQGNCALPADLDTYHASSSRELFRFLSPEGQHQVVAHLLHEDVVDPGALTELASGIAPEGSTEREKLYTMAESWSWKLATAAKGLCTQRQFTLCWNQASHQDRLLLLKSPQLRETHRAQLCSTLLGQSALNSEELLFLVRNWTGVAASRRKALFLRLAPATRAFILAYSELPVSLALIPLERDESVRLQALIHVAGLNNHRYNDRGTELTAERNKSDAEKESDRQRQLGRKLSSGMKQWGSARALFEARGVLDPELIDPSVAATLVLDHQVTGTGLSGFIAEAERKHLALPAALYRHAMATGSVPHGSPGVTTLLAAGLAEDFAAALAADEDRDVQVSASYSPGLAPARRAPSPIQFLAGELDLSDPERTWPRKPTAWSQIAAAASKNGFKIPALVSRAFSGELTDLAGSHVSFVRDEVELRANADYMGNCTFSYLPRCKDGSQFIGRVEYQREVYNFALNTGKGRGYHVPRDGRYAIGEVNSRFNRYNVPAELTAALRARVALLNEVIDKAKAKDTSSSSEVSSGS